MAAVVAPLCSSEVPVSGIVRPTPPSDINAPLYYASNLLANYRHNQGCISLLTHPPFQARYGTYRVLMYVFGNPYVSGALLGSLSLGYSWDHLGFRLMSMACAYVQHLF